MRAVYIYNEVMLFIFHLYLDTAINIFCTDWQSGQKIQSILWVLRRIGTFFIC